MFLIAIRHIWFYQQNSKYFNRQENVWMWTHTFIRHNEGRCLISDHCAGDTQCQGLKMIPMGTELKAIWPCINTPSTRDSQVTMNTKLNFSSQADPANWLWKGNENLGCLLPHCWGNTVSMGHWAWAKPKASTAWCSTIPRARNLSPLEPLHLVDIQ